jgi:peptidyl-prolyl cis-trans isomerase C
MSDGAHPYRELKLASRLFGKPPEALGPVERQRVRAAAEKQRELETLILATIEAAQVHVPEPSVSDALCEIRSRYPDDDAFQRALEAAGLDLDALRSEIGRDLRVEAVLDRVASRAAAVSDTEVEIFWFMHRERFRRAEARSLRHILVTINDTLAGSEREAARARIEGIQARLRKSPERFAEQALKHSECPTAMNGGLLGTLPRGKLYPELDAAAFALDAGALSAVLETELGFHLVRCDAIEPASTLALAEASAQIRQHLEQQRRGICQKSWINDLRRRAAAAA